IVHGNVGGGFIMEASEAGNWVVLQCSLPAVVNRMDTSSTNMHKLTEVNAGGQSNGSPPMDSPADMNCNLTPTVVVNQQTVTQTFGTDDYITTSEPRSSIEFKLQGHDSLELHHNQQSQGGTGLSSPPQENPSPTGPCKQSCGDDGQPHFPHVHVGITSTPNLDQLESSVKLAMADSEETVESLIETKDWSKTGLGPRSSWPAELNVLVLLLTRSTSPLAVYWGNEGYLIYNDVTLGVSGEVIWGEVWPALSNPVWATGRGYGNKALRFECDREGYEEECYFDFTISPIFLQDGSIGGILSIVHEVTQSILNQRRLTTLNQFSKLAPVSVSGAYSMITTILQESNNLDVPFSILYETKEVVKGPGTAQTSHVTFSPPHLESTPASKPDDLNATDHHSDARRPPQAAILRSTSFDGNLEVVSNGGVSEKIFSKATSTRHIPDSLLITPEEYEPMDPSVPVYDDPWAWPVRSVLADGIPRLVTLPKSPHKFARAIVLPIFENPSVLESRITTILIIGINPFRMLDNQYQDFVALLAASIASLLHFVHSREEERKRTEALFELNKAKISFFENISHELRTPLTLMLAPLQDVLNQTPEKAPTRANLEMIQRNTRRLLKLVNTLLQFSRIEAGKELAIFEETDLTKMTREISANFESMASGFKLDYIINCEDLSRTPGGIWVDRAMWGGIILNLVGNALKHTWVGSVTVHQYPSKGKDDRDGVAVDVRDTGVGISPEHFPSLFGRFNRLENKQSRSHEGTGIGLSLVKELTEIHGGNVSVTSEVDKGTCFHLWIPAGRSHLPSSQIKQGDSREAELIPRSRDNDIMSNKTDASMYVEEATQWISQKSLPRATLTASETDSTEEDRQENDDDTMPLGLDYMRDRQNSVELNQEYEVSTLNLKEAEISKTPIDLPDYGDFIVTEQVLSKRETGRGTSTHCPQIRTIPAETSLPIKEQAPSALAATQTGGMSNTSVSDDGGVGARVQGQDLAEEPLKGVTNLTSARSRRSYIIIVDDNNDMRAYLTQILGKDFRLRCAADGLDAIRLISERLHQGKRIDLVLSDVAMPNMNGYELLRHLRNNPETRMTPFILLSARAGEEANVEGLDLGADDCLIKPFSARELLARVRSTIRLSDLRHDLIREQRHALVMKQLIFSISVRIRSGLSLPQILETASKELFKVIRCNAIRVCRFRRLDLESGQHWVRFVSEIVRLGKPKILTPADQLLPKGLEVNELHHFDKETESTGDLRHVTDHQHPVFGSMSFISVALIHNRKVWGYLIAFRDADMEDWTQSEKLLFEQAGNQVSLAIAHASLWELKKSQQVEMEAAHAANEAKTQILANTSHELRTPIGAIMGALNALVDTDYNLTGEQRDLVKIMQITSDVALSVINDLLDAAKLEAGAMSLTIKECPGLVDTIKQSVRIFADRAGRKEVDLVLEPSEELELCELEILQGAMIWTDGDRLQQVIMNLIGNAVKFTSSGKVVIRCSFSRDGSGAVHGVTSATNSLIASSPAINSSPVSSHPKIIQPVPIPPDAQVMRGTLRFEVSDTGIGIDPEFLKNHIFKSFAQYDQSMTRLFGGTGLGLVISKQLVVMNGGILEVTSDVGEGSTFYFTWPVSLVSTSNSRNSSQRPLTARASLSKELAFDTRSVVVEPVPEARNMLGRILSQQSIDVILYENCDNVVNDEQERSPDLLGPSGNTLIANYRPKVHFFFCARSSTAESTVRTARELGELFKARNAKEKLKTRGHRDHIVSIILVVFLSPQGRSLAKDMMKRIRANGLETTVVCRYVVKPVKAERIIECLQMQGSYTPFTSGTPGGFPEVTQSGSMTPTSQPRGQRHYRLHQTHHHRRQSTGHFEESSEVIRADGSMELTVRDCEMVDYCNNNTEYASANQSPVTGAASIDILAAQQQHISTAPVHDSTQTEMLTWTTLESPGRSLTATQKRMRLGVGAESGGRDIGRGHVSGKSGETSGTDELVRSSSDGLAFSHHAARAAPGKRERKGKCILCVEDNIINLRVVQYQLQKLGYDTQSAADGQVAVDIIKAQIEMLAQEVVENSVVDGQETATATETSTSTATESETGRDFSSSFVVCDSSPNQRQHPFMSAGKGLLDLLRESDRNIRPFDTSEQGSVLNAPTGPFVLSTTPPPSSATSVMSNNSATSSQMSSFPTSNSRPLAAELMRAVDSNLPTGPILSDAAAGMVGHLSPQMTRLRSPNTSTVITTPRVDREKTPRHQHQGQQQLHQEYRKAGPKIDLILMDCAMPVKSGYDAASEIRSMGSYSTFAASIPIIALTASVLESTREKCIAAGMNGYLSKPTKLADLEAMLEQWIK
ncbi:hypothetical protein BGZ83_010347, partial [Gryganskiella cystojenkinii]